MKKLAVLALAFLIFLSVHALAQETGNPDRGYQCLESQIGNKTSETLSLEEAVFSTLALGSKQRLTDKIESERSEDDCWPESSCTIKETAQSFLAYDRLNRNTEGIEDYLLTKNSSAPDLNWFLQIDIQDHVRSSCRITYDGSGFDVEIGEDMRIDRPAGSCLPLSQSGYWLQIRNDCYGRTFQVSCEEEFITSLLYQRSGSSTIYVSSETHSAASSGTTEEKVYSQCFKTGNLCDYEGTLWATLALKDSVDVSSFLPYLVALAPDNQRLFPSTFIYMLTGGDDQFNEIEDNFKTEGFWQSQSTKYNKFYDTSLALLALQGSASQDADTAKDYLLSVQTPLGCWNNNNIRDTAFLLYAGWPKTFSGGGSGGTGGGDICAPPAGYCGSKFECTGQILSNKCPTFSESCCSVPFVERTCSEKGGRICSSNEVCSGSTASSIEGSCCLGTCQPKVVRETSACESLGGFCATSCTSSESQTSDSCNDPALICCVASASGGGSNLILWIILLVVLIAIVALAIIYRKKIQLWWFKMRSNRRPGSPPPSSQQRPPFSPRGPPPRQLIRSQGSSQQRRPVSRLDQEMDETLRKLREMSG